MANFFEKRKNEIEAYIRPLLDEDEALEVFTIGQSPRFLAGIFLSLFSEGLFDFPSSTLICMTTKRLVICHAFMLGSPGKLSISSASDPSEILNVPLSDIIQIRFQKGILVGKLIIKIVDKGEFKYSFASRPPARRAQKIASMISSTINQA